MTEHTPDRIWSVIDIPKTIAGVLAALSAAVVGSFLGVAGTLAGAAVASLIGSVGTEVYHRFIDRGRNRLHGTFTTAPAAVGTPPVAATAGEVPSAEAPTRPKIRWKRVAMVAGALFVLALGTLTLAEVISGRSVADATRGGAGDRLTVSSVFGDRSGPDRPAKKPSPAATPEPSATSDGSHTPEPTGTATTTPTTQLPTTPTGAPTTETPTPGGGPETDPAGGPEADNRPDNGTE